jgi:hypothetical protein
LFEYTSLWLLKTHIEKDHIFPWVKRES